MCKFSYSAWLSMWLIYLKINADYEQATKGVELWMAMTLCGLNYYQMYCVT